jgi:hypothetical protein
MLQTITAAVKGSQMNKLLLISTVALINSVSLCFPSEKSLKDGQVVTVEGRLANYKRGIAIETNEYGSLFIRKAEPGAGTIDRMVKVSGVVESEYEVAASEHEQTVQSGNGGTIYWLKNVKGEFIYEPNEFIEKSKDIDKEICISDTLTTERRDSRPHFRTNFGRCYIAGIYHCSPEIKGKKITVRGTLKLTYSATPKFQIDSNSRHPVTLSAFNEYEIRDANWSFGDNDYSEHIKVTGLLHAGDPNSGDRYLWPYILDDKLTILYIPDYNEQYIGKRVTAEGTAIPAYFRATNNFGYEKTKIPIVLSQRNAFIIEDPNIKIVK